jgi:hypothetical protein
VTEHDGRLLCAAGLRKRVAIATPQPARWAWLATPLHLAVGLAVGFSLFYFLGLVLLRTPTAWHEGTAVERTLIGVP